LRKTPTIGPLRAVALVGLTALAVLAPQAQSVRQAQAEPQSPFYELSSVEVSKLTIKALPAAKIRAEARKVAVPPVVGDRRLWPALDRRSNRDYMKYFTLRAVGANIEVWVASDDDGVSKGIEFPAGDCRNDDRVQLGDAQAAYLAQQFDAVMYPKEGEAFSVPPPRDGSKATLAARSGLPADYFVGDGNRVVALVDNIRDESFFDVDVRVGIGGVFVPSFNDDLDRNVITVDAVDWVHRTGPTPPNDPVENDLCRNRTGRPFLIEATFAHEYQHLLEEYQDPNEVSWVNEGLSMFAEQLTGYSDAKKTVDELGFSGTVQCFLGTGSRRTAFNPNPTLGGPENSLTVWGDRGDSEIVCDYGAAETFMHYLAGRFGLGFISAFHHDPDPGLVSLRKLAAGVGADGTEIIHDWAAMLALDAVLDRGAVLSGGQAAKYQTPTLDASVDWSIPNAYLAPGAPPNGSDFVRLRGKSGAFLKASQISSISFDGSFGFPPRPVQWRVDTNAPGRSGDAALHSGGGGGLDRGLVRQVKVPAGASQLTFQTRYDLAPGLDFGFVQVSTNGGRSWKSLSGSLTTSTAHPTANPTARGNVPGLTGKSGPGPFPIWTAASFDLSAYRGKTVLLGFRFVSDPRVTYPGWWIDDIRIGGRQLSDGASLGAWKSLSQVNPSLHAGGFTVQLVGYTTAGAKRAFIHRLRIDSRQQAKLSGPTLRRLLAGGYDVVAAIVTYDEPSEAKRAYAQYVLKADDVVQPGGRKVR
jgi:immune inhibitor InhA-like protein